MNRTRRKAIKMARKHKRGIFAETTFAFWRALPIDQRPDYHRDTAIINAMRRAYLACQ